MFVVCVTSGVLIEKADFSYKAFFDSFFYAKNAVTPDRTSQEEDWADELLHMFCLQREYMKPIMV